MATLSKKVLADLARYRLAGGTDIAGLGLKPYQIYKWEESAIQRLVYRDLRLGEKITQWDKQTAEYAQAMLYVKPFNGIEAVDGIIDLSSEVANGLIVPSIPLFGSVNSESVIYPLVWVDTEAELKRQKSRMFAYYTSRGNFLLTRNTDGLLDSLNGDISLFAAKFPTISEVPLSRQEQLINIMVEFYAEALNLPSAEKEAEK